MRYIIILLISLSSFQTFGQLRNWVFCGDLRCGISNIIDDKDDSKFNLVMGGLIGLNIKTCKEKTIGFKGSMYLLLNGTKNLKTNNNIRIANLGISQNLLFRANSYRTLISLGLFENVLLNRTFESEFIGYDNVFNPYDFGLNIGLSQKIIQVNHNHTLYLELSYYKSILSIYDNQHKVILTSGYSNWTGMNGFTLGFSTEIN